MRERVTTLPDKREERERERERRRHFKEKMSREEAHHHRRPWIRAWRKKKSQAL